MVHKSVIPIVILLLLSFASNVFAANFSPSVPAEVEKGSHADFICESENKQTIIECRFTVPGFETEIIIYNGIINEKYEFVGDGFSKGQCGLRVRSVNKLNAGKVKCSLALSDNTQQESETNVTVLYPIEKLNIVSNSKDAGDCGYEENNTMDFTCSAEGGFPAPTLSLFLGGQILNSTSQKNCSWRGQANFINNEQQLLCRAEQTSSSGWENTENSTRQVFVKYAPRLPIESDEPVMWVSVYAGNEVNVTVEILANPEPYAFDLSKNGIILDVQPRFNAAANGVFEYSWTMLAVQQADFDSVWNLNVSNDIGNINVAVKLRQLTTTSTRPPDNGLGYGNILIIAFVPGSILLALPLAGCIICARKKKLLCFKDTTRKQSEEAKLSCELPLINMNHQHVDVKKSAGTDSTTPTIV